MKKIVLILISIFIIASDVYANEQNSLKKHFIDTIDKIIIVVKDTNLEKIKRNTKIIDILTPMFDFTLMGKLSLGKKWKQLNTVDRKRFVELYVERMKQSYSSKLDAYSDEKVEVTKIKQAKKNRIELITDLVQTDAKLKISYKFYKPKKAKKDKDTWLIYDVVISGVSILKTDKAQFREFLQTNTIEELMDQLAKK